MTLQEAVEHQKRIATCVQHLNMSISLANDAGLSTELSIVEISSPSHGDEQRVTAKVTVDPSNLE